MRYGFVIDQNRCIGCHACTVACKEEHQVPVGVFRTWVKYVEKGAFPHTSRHFAVMRCNHCDSAPCIEICPTKALYRRPDGIVDFDNLVCIGCKGCMQACPYDALYINPENNTAAKCNFCAHRVEANLEPACVIVCPTQAIVCGDLDDSESKVSILAAGEVSVRKPQKGTQPKLYYVGVEPDLLQPARLSRQKTDMFADRYSGLAGASDFAAQHTREVYDVTHVVPWGWKIAAYLWTKSIAAGVLLVAAMLLSLSPHVSGMLLNVVSPGIALAALGATMALLVFDLKRPERFLFLLLKPNFRSWLVLGAYVLMAYGALCAAWLLVGVLAGGVPRILAWLTAALAAASACYSAFLFAQAKGRDLWQSPVFFWHLLAQAFAAGSAVLLIANITAAGLAQIARPCLEVLLVSLAAIGMMIVAEGRLVPMSEDARLAHQVLVSGKLSASFWGLVVGIGLVGPIALGLWASLSNAHSSVTRAAAALAITGLWCFEDLWVKAGQAVPLS